MRGCRLLCLFLSLPLVYACVVEEFSCLDRYWGDGVPTLFFAGLLGTAVGYRLLFHRSRLFSFFEVFLHELAHMVVTYLTLGFVGEFLARLRDGALGVQREGHVRYASPVGGCFLRSLAPYYFPTFTVPFLVARLFAGYSGTKVLNLCIGVTLGFHYVLFASDFAESQRGQAERALDTAETIPDTQRVGRLFSFLFVLIAFALILMFVLNVVWGAEKQVLWYHFVNIWPRALRYYKEVVVRLWDFVRTLI
jgi:hypothetical protein